jgi:cyclopropane fatty-acyl-phospholipid synthase-like methyltransferase
MICPVCQSKNSKIVYTSNSEHSISSLAREIKGKTEVSLCRDCSHVFTRPLENLNDYYNEQYNILTDTEEEDQLFVTKEGKEFYRLEYQADIVERKLKLNDGDTILDYGCAKASTLKILKNRHHKITPMCFDVSDAYQAFWSSFIEPNHSFANIKVPDNWNNNISHITSFFALEHAENPAEFVRDIHRLLKNNGECLIIVPDFSNNWADLIVADHVNHFTKTSIRRLLENNGFIVSNIDNEIYHGTFIVTAQKQSELVGIKTQIDNISALIDRTKEIASFWESFSDRISAIEEEINTENFVIYGSGFYGAFISTLMTTLPQYYLDQSSHRQGREFFGKAIIAPEDMPHDTKHMIVGLNPSIAKKVIESNKDLNLENIRVHYIG